MHDLKRETIEMGQWNQPVLKINYRWEKWIAKEGSSLKGYTACMSINIYKESHNKNNEYVIIRSSVGQFEFIVFW